MKNDSDNKTVSVGGWMGMMAVAAIPVIGWIMVLVWSFTGDNQTLKNYFRARLCWIIMFALPLIYCAIQAAPYIEAPIKKMIQDWMHSNPSSH